MEEPAISWVSGGFLEIPGKNGNERSPRTRGGRFSPPFGTFGGAFGHGRSLTGGHLFGGVVFLTYPKRIDQVTFWFPRFGPCTPKGDHPSWQPLLEVADFDCFQGHTEDGRNPFRHPRNPGRIRFPCKLFSGFAKWKPSTVPGTV